MLNLSRKAGMGIILRSLDYDYKIEIRVNKIRNNNIVELGIDAPESVTITRKDFEVTDTRSIGSPYCQDSINLKID